MVQTTDYVATVFDGKSNPAKVTVTFTMALNAALKGHSATVILMVEAVELGVPDATQGMDVGKPFEPDCSEHYFYYLEFQTRKYDYVSSGVAQLFGIPREEFKVTGFAWFTRAVHPEDWKQWSESARLAWRANPGQAVKTSVEYRLTTAKGQERYFHDSSTFVSDANGRLRFAYGIASGVTDRRVAEMALRQSESRFQDLLSDLDEIVWCYSVDQERMLYLNDAVEAIYGRPKQDFLFHPNLWGDVIHPEDRDSLKNAMEHSFANPGRIVQAPHRALPQPTSAIRAAWSPVRPCRRSPGSPTTPRNWQH